MLAAAAATATAHRAHAKATGRWTGVDDDSADTADEAERCARVALDHLDAGRWDDAEACAQLCLELEESCASGDVWREFGLLVEEAAAVGREGG